MSDLQMTLELPAGYNPAEWWIHAHGNTYLLVHKPFETLAKGVFRLKFQENCEKVLVTVEPVSPMLTISLHASLNLDFPWMYSVWLKDLEWELQVGLLQGVARCIEMIQGTAA